MSSVYCNGNSSSLSSECGPYALSQLSNQGYLFLFIWRQRCSWGILSYVQTNETFQWQYPYHCPCLYDFVSKEKMEAACCTHLHNGLFFHFRGRCVCVGLQQQPRHRSNPSVQRWQRSQQRSQAASIATGLHWSSLWPILIGCVHVLVCHVFSWHA